MCCAIVIVWEEGGHGGVHLEQGLEHVGSMPLWRDPIVERPPLLIRYGHILLTPC